MRRTPPRGATGSARVPRTPLSAAHSHARTSSPSSSSNATATAATAAATATDTTTTPPSPSQSRSKHIEVCVRLRPLVVQNTVSSSSFFEQPSQSQQSSSSSPKASQSQSSIPKASFKNIFRKPSIPRPSSSRLGNSNSSSTTSTASTATNATDNTTNNNICAWTILDDDDNDSHATTIGQHANTDRIPGRTHTYTLDRVHGPTCTTRDLYDTSVQDLVHAAMDGYHTAVLAYGQTCTGKTHTMTGTVEEPGLVPLAVHECFGWIVAQPGQTSSSSSREYLLRVSYLEVYKEHIRDLLAPTPSRGSGGLGSTSSSSVRLFESNGQLQIKGLREQVVTNAHQVFALLAEGEARRQVGATHMNQHSSRSHVMVRLWIESRDANTGTQRVSSLSLVDLAGSESVRLSKNSDRRSEGHYINKSLMALGQVVYALSESGDSTHKPNQPPQHVPYRDSKLTRLLQPALSGRAQIVLVCCISPLVSHMEESHNTFKFAVRAKKIPQKASLRDQRPDDETTLLQSYRDEIQDLKLQLKEAQASGGGGGGISNSSSATELSALAALPADADQEMKELVQAIATMEQLILKTNPQSPSPNGMAASPGNIPCMGSLSLDDPSTLPSTTPDQHHGSVDHPQATAAAGTVASSTSIPTTPIVAPPPITPRETNLLRTELTRVQGLLGSVLLQSSKRNGDGMLPLQEQQQQQRLVDEAEEVKHLRAALEEQQVSKQLKDADSSFLQAALEEKDNLLAEVSKLLEAVEERQAELEAENNSLRSQLEELRNTPR